MTETKSETHEEHLRKVDKEMGDLSTAYREISSKIKSSDLTLKVLCNRQEKFENIMTEMNQKYKMLVAMIAHISGSKNEDEDKQTENSAPQNMSGHGLDSNRLGPTPTYQVRDENRMNIRLPKIDFPYFNGDEPRKWIRKARKYFQLHHVTE
ncbi:Uncharacterized protein Adt_36044 [Abeliophyllum distichum]|uniref:Uncharacterized protein n=1 Tax=Abeliophyllum distichum TaxID=126358 RepID=A0ABD1QGF0_9LAMI